MNAKEKAKELIQGFRLFVGTSEGDEGETINNYLIGKKQAKMCALICVEEILKIPACWFDKSCSLEEDESDTIEFWESVKSEIENL